MSDSDQSAVPATLPDFIFDSIGEEKACWILHGEFPLEEIHAGRRACRYGWRDRGNGEPLDSNGDNGFAMLAVISGATGGDRDAPSLWLESEYATVKEGIDPFHSITDMMAKDWYLDEADVEPQQAPINLADLRLSLAEKERVTLEGGWKLPVELFGDDMIDINDFDVSNYTHFLDTVSSLEDLIIGLQELSPLADDALAIAQGMRAPEFRRFKHVLAEMRTNPDESSFPSRYDRLALPSLFVPCVPIMKSCDVTLGVAMLQYIRRSST